MSGWSRFENYIIDDYARVLGLTALGVYIVLCRFANNHSRRAWPSTKKIAVLLGVSRMTVIRAIRKLESTRLIVVERKRGSVNVYRLTDNSSISGDTCITRDTCSSITDVTSLSHQCDRDVTGEIHKQYLYNKTNKQHNNVVVTKQEQEALEALQKLGMTDAVARRLISTNDPNRILDVCRVAQGKRNPAGFVRAALQNNWMIVDENAQRGEELAEAARNCARGYRNVIEAIGYCPLSKFKLTKCFYCVEGGLQ